MTEQNLENLLNLALDATEEEREKFRQEYLDRKGMQESFRW